eukprot:s2400_g10.t3
MVSKGDTSFTKIATLAWLKCRFAKIGECCPVTGWPTRLCQRAVWLPSHQRSSRNRELRTMSFWGCIVPPGQSKKVETRAGELLHLSQACLAPDTPNGASSKVLVEQGGQSYAVACLKEGSQEFCALDLFLDAKEAKLAVKGKATVHLTGYFEADDDDLKDDDAPQPRASPKAAPKASPKASPKAEAKASPKASPKPAAKAAAMPEEDDDDDMMEDEEGEEEEPKASDEVVKTKAASPKVEPKKASPKAQPKAAAAAAEDDDDDQEEEEEEEEEEEDAVVDPMTKGKAQAKAAPVADDDDDDGSSDEEEEEEEATVLNTFVCL